MEVELIENIERLSEIEREWNELLGGLPKVIYLFFHNGFFRGGKSMEKIKNYIPLRSGIIVSFAVFYFCIKQKKGPLNDYICRLSSRSDRMDFIVMRGVGG